MIVLSDAHLFFQVCENVLTVLFTLELLVRFCALRVKCKPWRDMFVLIVDIFKQYVVSSIDETKNISTSSPKDNNNLIMRLVRLRISTNSASGVAGANSAAQTLK